MEGDENGWSFQHHGYGRSDQRFVNTEVSAIVHDHPSKTQVMVYTMHIIEPHINAHFPI
jgi:hypothetical protein